MKEQTEKQAIDYTIKTLPDLLALAISGDKDAAAEIVSRQEKQAAEIEQLKIKANSKRKPAAEKTPVDLAKDNAYYRTALLVKQFGLESVNMQTLTTASAFLERGLAQGNLRQAFNRVSQVIRAQAIEEEVFPAWILTAAEEIPALDENAKLDDPAEVEKIEQIKAIISKYLEQAAQEQAEQAEQAAQAAQEATTAAQEATTAAPAKKGGKK